MVTWWLCVSGNGDTRKFGSLSQIRLRRSRSTATQNNRDLNKAILHIWSKFVDPSLNGSPVIARTSKRWTHRRTDGQHTDSGNDNTRRPKLASGKKNRTHRRTNGYYILSWDFVGGTPTKVLIPTNKISCIKVHSASRICLQNYIIYHNQSIQFSIWAFIVHRPGLFVKSCYGWTLHC